MTWSDPSRAPTSAFSIGQRVRELRGDASQANFAERLGVDRKTVGRWEAGPLMIGATSLIRLREAFGADINWVLTGNVGSPKPAADGVHGAWLAAVSQADLKSLETAAQALNIRRYRVMLSQSDKPAAVIFSSDRLESAIAEAQLAPSRWVLDIYTGRRI
jgi:transcriptional regulator with XRE-family HTH domain